MKKWASEYIKELQANGSVEFNPYGTSMEPLIFSGDKVRVVKTNYYSSGDIVLCEVNGKHYLHLVKVANGNRYLIGNNKGFNNGWITIDKIFGKYEKIAKNYDNLPPKEIQNAIWGFVF